MQSKELHVNFRHYWGNDRINYSVRVFIALVGVVLPCWYLKATHEVTPLLLGIIAAALAESDDNLAGKINGSLITLICFLIASVSIEVLFDYPLFFALGLFSSTFGFIMLGAMGTRYANIAFASLLLAVYTMLGANNSVNLWYQPLLLLAGASWYSVLSICWQILWPNQPVQQSLANVFQQFGHYLDNKSKLFEPVADLGARPYRIEAANQNAQVVNALNSAKTTLLHRANRGQSDKFLKIYFIAQDIHERASSSHYRYCELATTFQRSDVLFRFQRLLQLQAIACRDIARALRMGKPYHHHSQSITTLDELQQSLNYLKAQNNPQWRPLLNQLDFLFHNLTIVEQQLLNINNPDAELITQQTDTQLQDTEAHNIREMWRRIYSQLNTDSGLFRHAIRLGITLVLGYSCIQLFDLQRGYWILLTSLFVCQPNYSATRQKLKQRVIGTLGGLFAGVPLLYLFPGQEGQLVLMIVTGVLFFAFRTVKYDWATAFITLFVLFCFNQLGEGFAVMLPRLGDTLLGCALAVLAVSFILPDWESKRLHKVMANAINTNKDYLAQIIAQYRIGKKDNLNYRVARRDAHNQDAQLSIAINNMLSEPEKYQINADDSFRFLILNHAMLNYISALGAHRTQLEDNQTHQLVTETHRIIHAHLECISTQLSGELIETTPILNANLEQRLSQWRDEDCTSTRMVLQQLHLIHCMLPELHGLADNLAPALTTSMLKQQR